MFTETLSPETAKALAVLGGSELFKQCSLAGGTACALHLGHRVSVDLDFFTEQEFDPKQVASALQRLGNFTLDQESWGTLLGTFDEVKVSLFVYRYPPLFPCTIFEGVSILDLRDIAAMKIDAIGSRGIRRDFIDLYFICQSGLALQEALVCYDRKYGLLASNLLHIKKSLVYFEDAEESPMPHMLKKIEWNTVKHFFAGEIAKWARV